VPFGTVEAVQVTFISDTAYQAELICDSPLRNPQVLASFKLPPFVTKVPGTAGLVWGAGTSGVTLELWGRHRSIILDNQELSDANGDLP